MVTCTSTEVEIVDGDKDTDRIDFSTRKVQNTEAINAGHTEILLTPATRVKPPNIVIIKQQCLRT